MIYSAKYGLLQKTNKTNKTNICNAFYRLPSFVLPSPKNALHNLCILFILIKGQEISYSIEGDKTQRSNLFLVPLKISRFCLL